MIIPRKHSFFQIALLFLFANGYSQKLPNKQEKSIWAPATIKIDGKPDEWGNFQADSKANRIFYTIANDNDNIYLAVMAEDIIAIDKIITGGITLNISADEKDFNSSASLKVSITFPFITNREADNYATSWHSYIRYKRNSTPAGLDSVINLLNTKMDKLYKEIKITGVKEIPDSSLSVYNSNGVKAVSHFDPKARYCYEIAVPLSYFPFFKNRKATFYYDLRLKGKSERPINPIDAHTIYNEINMDAQFEAAATSVAGKLLLTKAP